MARPSAGYRLADGTKVDGVTSIIKTINYGGDALIGWANKIGREGLKQSDVLKHAGRVGSCSHDQVEAILTQTLFDSAGWTELELADAIPCVEAFRKWKAGKRIKVIAMELTMVSETYRCGGTLDLVCRINGGPLQLVDFNTSSYIYETHIVQVGAYVDLLADVHNKIVESALIVRLGKDGEVEELLVEGAMLERGRRLFHLARELKAMESQIKSDLKTSVRPFADPSLIVDLPVATKEVNIA